MEGSPHQTLSYAVRSSATGPEPTTAAPTLRAELVLPLDASPSLPRPRTARTTVLPEVRNDPNGLILLPRDRSRYEHEGVLGRGGMGEVSLARDHDIGRKVALKRLTDAESPHAVARFIDEVRIVGNLEHPNIVPIHDVGIDEHGALFFVMKFVEGETLRAVIDRLVAGDIATHRRYSFEHRLDIFTSLLQALHYAHARGFVHRDIKPENIMIGPYGEVMLMDWGIAHVMRSEPRVQTEVRASTPSLPRASKETIDGQIVGTPEYMSPEQALGDVATLDGRSDLYSAFAVVWELLTLRPYVPQGKTPVETLLAVLDRAPPRSNDVGYGRHPYQRPVPVELRHFLWQGLQRERDARFPSAEAVLVELERVRGGEFAVNCPITLVKRFHAGLGRMMDRRPMAWLGLALLFVVLLVGLAGWVALLRAWMA